MYSYKVSNMDVINIMVTTAVNNTALYILKLLRVDLKSSHHRKEIFTDDLLKSKTELKKLDMI